jgi:spermidine synthase
LSLRAAAIFAAVAGFVSLSYELLWFRAYSYDTGGSPVTFGLVLGIYLAGLAVGADLTGKACRRAGSSLLDQKALLGWITLAANVTGFFVIPVMANTARFDAMLWSSFALMAVAAALFGGVLPLVSNIAVSPDSASGRNVSIIYFANTAGCVAGSLITGFVLMDIWSTSTISLVLAALSLTLTSYAWRERARAMLLVPALAMLSLVLGTSLLFDRLYEKLQFKDAYTGQRFEYLVENRHGVVATTADGITFGGGVYDGRISASLIPDRNGIQRAYAAVALHKKPSRVLMIGLSTGAWAHVLASSPGVQSLTVVEINPGYLEIIGHFPLVASLPADPKVKLHIDDGRRWLVHNPDEKFDLIVYNATFHYRANSTNLLSREFLQLIRAHLNEGGIYFFNTTGSQDAYKTAFTEFPYGLRVLNFVAVSDSPIALDSARWDSTLRRHLAAHESVVDSTRSDDAARLAELESFPSSIHRVPTGTGLESRESVLARIPRAGVITDDNMLPEWRTLLLWSNRSEERKAFN